MTDLTSEWTVANGVDGTFNVIHCGNLVASNVEMDEVLSVVADPRVRLALLGQPQPPETLVSGSAEVVRSHNFSATKIDTSRGGVRITLSNFDVAMHLRSLEELDDLIDVLSRMREIVGN